MPAFSKLGGDGEDDPLATFLEVFEAIAHAYGGYAQQPYVNFQGETVRVYTIRTLFGLRKTVIGFSDQTSRTIYTRKEHMQFFDDVLQETVKRLKEKTMQGYTTKIITVPEDYGFFQV